MEKFYFGAKPGRVAEINGREWLFFSGYDYLGMQHNLPFMKLIAEGMEKYGWIFPSSRISNTRLPVFTAFEKHIAEITGMEDAVVLSSGFLAGELATSLWKHDLLNLRPSHPAILHENRSTHPSCIAFDSVNIFRPEISVPTEAIIAQASQIIVDDSHGFGIIGKQGEGYSSYIPEAYRRKFLLCFSLSKAWSINAGAVCGPADIIRKLRSHPIYTAATPPSPALLFAAMHAQDIYLKQLLELRSHLRVFTAKIENIGIEYKEELPVFVLPDSTQEENLRKNEIIISSFAYPDPKGKKLNRVVINALHTDSDLAYLGEVLQREV